MRRAEFNVGSLPHSVGSGLSALTLKLASAQTGMKTFRIDIVSALRKHKC